MTQENVSTETLWDIAVRLTADEGKKQPIVNQASERTLILLGNKGVGKTLLTYRFLERNDTPKPTLALEYSFGRRAGRSLVKDTCHIWELGGGSIFASLLPQLVSVPLMGNKNAFIVMMLDLSVPHLLWTTFEALYATLGSIAKEFQASNPTAYKQLIDSTWNRIGRDHPDASSLDPYPIPLAIIGGKYDLFKDTDPDHKKMICRSLRGVACVLGASLHFYSTKDAVLVKRGKELLSHGGFGTSFPKNISQDYNLPLAIPSGADSLQQINMGLNQGASASVVLERIKHLYTTHFPQESLEKTLPDDPAQNPSFREPVIDSLRSQKDNELERLQQEIERIQQLNTSTNFDLSL